MRVALLSVIALADAYIHLVRPGYLVLGLLDEPAHLATTAILLGAASTRWTVSARWWFAAMTASVLIDVDHLPQAVGSSLMTAGTPRPYTHSLLTVGVLVAAAALSWRWSRARSTILLAIASGVTAHLLRDLATAPVSLWWPASDRGVEIPYSVYAVLLVAAAAIGPRPTSARGAATGRSARSSD